MATATPERLDAPADHLEPDGLYEVIDGHIVEKTTGAYEYWLAAVIHGRLDRYADEHPIGRAVIEMIFDLNPHIARERRPDVAFVSFDRWARDRRIPRDRSWAVIPDLAIEFVSLTNIPTIRSGNCTWKHGRVGNWPRRWRVAVGSNIFGRDRGDDVGSVVNPFE